MARVGRLGATAAASRGFPAFVRGAGQFFFWPASRGNLGQHGGGLDLNGIFEFAEHIAPLL
jgi:hypothetical protein